MIIIGEKINGTRKEVATAIEAKDEDKIRMLARTQAEAGANYIDVNAGTTPDKEPETLVWLVKLVQAEVDIPLSLDSPNPAALNAALPHVNKTPLINSVSAEKDRLDHVLPIVAKYSCPVILLAVSDSGLPKGIDDRMEVIRVLIGLAREQNIADDKLYIDPLIMTISTGNEHGNIALTTISKVREEFPDVHITGGLSNISFGMPARAILNQSFISMAIAAGLDSAITDPTDSNMLATILAAETLKGKDRFCKNYNGAYRRGLFGNKPTGTENLTDAVQQ
jgi:5-methyltetrahydrofolate corrinoid/iron sulfur protein methyltransferase